LTGRYIQSRIVAVLQFSFIFGRYILIQNKMKRTVLFLIYAVFSAVSFAQLSFDQLGSDPAYCRLYSYQSGNGVVYASASGGTSPYTHQWTNLSTGFTTTNTTWGGLNPGLYKIQVTDAVFDVLIDTVLLDSINPTAKFYEAWGNLMPTTFGYTGFLYEDAKFVNTSTGVNNSIDPLDDTTFFWNLGVTGAWEIIHDYSYAPEQGYFSGDYDVRLIAKNKNGCSDTLLKHIHIFGPVGIEDDSKAESFISIYGKPQQNALHFNCGGFSESMLVTIFSISGETIMTFEVINGDNEVGFNAGTGVYAYSVVGKES